jgi:hypothetical protein
MGRQIDIDGDRWITSLDRRSAHPGMHALVFHCVSDAQRPYRVIELPAEEAGEEGGPEFSDRELRELFSNAHTMDYSRDESAEPDRRGYGRHRIE